MHSSSESSPARLASAGRETRTEILKIEELGTLGECRRQYGTCALPPRIEGLEEECKPKCCRDRERGWLAGGGAQPSFGVRRDLDENTEGRELLGSGIAEAEALRRT